MPLKSTVYSSNYSFSYLNKERINSIKEQLVSRTESDIVCAVEEILKFFEYEDAIESILFTDIPILLSEAIAPEFSKSNVAIYQCLREMCKFKKFFSDGHALIVAQGACRSANFLMSESNLSIELDYLLQLLASVLPGYEIFHMSPDKRLLLQIIDMMDAISNKKINNASIQISGALVLISLLDISCIKLRQESMRTTLTVLIRNFESLSALIETMSMDPLLDASMEMTCCLSSYICRSISPQNGSVSLLDVEVQEDISEKISKCIIKRVVPYVTQLPGQQFERNPTRMSCLFESMVLLLKCPVVDSRKLAQEFATARTLSFIPHMLSNAESWGDDELRSMSQQLLTQLLICLSLEVFRFPDMWSEGEEHFVKDIETGVLALPPDPCDWLNALAQPMAHRCVKLVVLLFLYYQVLIEGSLAERNTYLALSQFVGDLSATSSRPIIVKALWLVLALSKVSCTTVEEEANEDDATILKVSEMLDRLDDLGDVYTHHPTLLYYTFSSSLFSSTLQNDVMKQWLQHQTDEDGVFNFKEFLQASEVAKFTILNLIQLDEGVVLQKAYAEFRCLLEDVEGDKEADVVWRILPMVLGKVCADAIAHENLEKIIELALIKFPATRDPHDELRAATLLPAAVAAIPAPTLPIWNLAHRLLTYHIDQNDFQVATCYMQSEQFLKKLLDNLSSSCPVTAQLCLKISTCLCIVHRRESLPQVDNPWTLNIVPIIHHLRSQHVSLRQATVLFIQEILENGWSLPICKIESPQLNLLKVTYFLLLSATMQDGTEECWECLRTFLNFLPVDDGLMKHFLNNHWLLYLIEVSLASLAASPAMLACLETWYGLRTPRQISTRCLNIPLECVTVTLIAEQIIKSSKTSLLTLLNKIRNSGEIVSEELAEAIEAAVNENENPQMEIDEDENQQAMEVQNHISSQNPEKMVLSQDQERLGLSQNQDKMGLSQNQGRLGLEQNQDGLALSHNQDTLAPSQNQDRLRWSQQQDKMGLSQNQRLPGLSQNHDQMGLSQNQSRLGFSQNQGFSQGQDNLENQTPDKPRRTQNQEIGSEDALLTSPEYQTQTQPRNVSIFDEPYGGLSQNMNLFDDQPASQVLDPQPKEETTLQAFQQRKVNRVLAKRSSRQLFQDEDEPQNVSQRQEDEATGGHKSMLAKSQLFAGEEVPQKKEEEVPQKSMVVKNTKECLSLVRRKTLEQKKVSFQQVQSVEVNESAVTEDRVFSNLLANFSASQASQAFLPLSQPKVPVNQPMSSASNVQLLLCKPIVSSGQSVLKNPSSTFSSDWMASNVPGSQPQATSSVPGQPNKTFNISANQPNIPGQTYVTSYVPGSQPYVTFNVPGSQPYVTSSVPGQPFMISNVPGSQPFVTSNVPSKPNKTFNVSANQPNVTSNVPGQRFTTSNVPGSQPYVTSNVPGSQPCVTSNVPGSQPYVTSNVPGSQPYVTSNVPGSQPYGTSNVPGSQPYVTSNVPGSQPYVTSSVPGQPFMISNVPGSQPFVTSNVPSKPNKTSNVSASQPLMNAQPLPVNLASNVSATAMQFNAHLSTSQPLSQKTPKRKTCKKKIFQEPMGVSTVDDTINEVCAASLLMEKDDHEAQSTTGDKMETKKGFSVQSQKLLYQTRNEEQNQPGRILPSGRTQLLMIPKELNVVDNRQKDENSSLPVTSSYFLTSQPTVDHTNVPGGTQFSLTSNVVQESEAPDDSLMLADTNSQSLMVGTQPHEKKKLHKSAKKSKRDAKRCEEAISREAKLSNKHQTKDLTASSHGREMDIFSQHLSPPIDICGEQQPVLIYGEKKPLEVRATQEERKKTEIAEARNEDVDIFMDYEGETVCQMEQEEKSLLVSTNDRLVMSKKTAGPGAGKQHEVNSNKPEFTYKPKENQDTVYRIEQKERSLLVSTKETQKIRLALSTKVAGPGIEKQQEVNSKRPELTYKPKENQDTVCRREPNERSLLVSTKETQNNRLAMSKKTAAVENQQDVNSNQPEFTYQQKETPEVSTKWYSKPDTASRNLFFKDEMEFDIFGEYQMERSVITQSNDDTFMEVLNEVVMEVDDEVSEKNVGDTLKEKQRDVGDTLKEKQRDVGDTLKEKQNDVDDALKEKLKDVYYTTNENRKDVEDTPKEKLQDVEDTLKEKQKDVDDAPIEKHNEMEFESVQAKFEDRWTKILNLDGNDLGISLNMSQCVITEKRRQSVNEENEKTMGATFIDKTGRMDTNLFSKGNLLPMNESIKDSARIRDTNSLQETIQDMPVFCEKQGVFISSSPKTIQPSCETRKLQEAAIGEGTRKTASLDGGEDSRQKLWQTATGIKENNRMQETRADSGLQTQKKPSAGGIKHEGHALGSHTPMTTQKAAHGGGQRTIGGNSLHGTGIQSVLQSQMKPIFQTSRATESKNAQEDEDNYVLGSQTPMRTQQAAYGGSQKTTGSNHLPENETVKKRPIFETSRGTKVIKTKSAQEDADDCVLGSQTQMRTQKAAYGSAQRTVESNYLRENGTSSVQKTIFEAKKSAADFSSATRGINHYEDVLGSRMLKKTQPAAYGSATETSCLQGKNAMKIQAKTCGTPSSTAENTSLQRDKDAERRQGNSKEENTCAFIRETQKSPQGHTSPPKHVAKSERRILKKKTFTENVAVKETSSSQTNDPYDFFEEPPSQTTFSRSSIKRKPLLKLEVNVIKVEASQTESVKNGSLGTQKDVWTKTSYRPLEVTAHSDSLFDSEGWSQKRQTQNFSGNSAAGKENRVGGRQELLKEPNSFGVGRYQVSAPRVNPYTLNCARETLKQSSTGNEIRKRFSDQIDNENPYTLQNKTSIFSASAGKIKKPMLGRRKLFNDDLEFSQDSPQTPKNKASEVTLCSSYSVDTMGFFDTFHESENETQVSRSNLPVSQVNKPNCEELFDSLFGSSQITR